MILAGFPQHERNINQVVLLNHSNVSHLGLSATVPVQFFLSKKINAHVEIDLFEWGKNGYHSMYWGTRPGVDKVPRINYDMTSRQEFIDRYERPNIPVVICGLTKLWPAHVHWNIDVRHPSLQWANL